MAAIPPQPVGANDCKSGPSFPGPANNLCTSDTTPLQLTVTCVDKSTGNATKNGGCKGGGYKDASPIYAGVVGTAPTGTTYVLGGNNNSYLQVTTDDKDGKTGKIVADKGKFAPACTAACPQGVWLANWAPAAPAAAP